MNQSEKKPYIEHALRRRHGMDAGKAEDLTSMMEKAEDLHWTCPKCKTKRVGTMKELMQGCLSCLIQ